MFNKKVVPFRKSEEPDPRFEVIVRREPNESCFILHGISAEEVAAVFDQLGVELGQEYFSTLSFDQMHDLVLEKLIQRRTVPGGTQ